MPPNDTGPVRYVVVVHGMGESRFNETVLSVVNRFAEARSGRSWPPPSDIVSLGMACGQTGIETLPSGLPWLEFSQIPCQPLPQSVDPFYGNAESTGKNLRFVDMHWGNLLQDAWLDVGQDPNDWLDALIGRLRRKAYKDGKVPQWALETIGVLRDTVRLVHGILRFKLKDFDELAFGKCLDDVHVRRICRGSRASGAAVS